MSNQQITISAKRAWLASDSVESFADWLAGMHGKGLFWGAS